MCEIQMEKFSSSLHACETGLDSLKETTFHSASSLSRFLHGHQKIYEAAEISLKIALTSTKIDSLRSPSLLLETNTTTDQSQLGHTTPT